MDVLLITMTFGSLLLAAAMAFVTWRVTSRERERSVARMMALASDFQSDEPIGPTEEAGPNPDGEGLFGRTTPPAPRLLAPALAVGGAVLGIVLLTLLLLGGRGTTAKGDAAGDARPIELLSLRHDVKDGTMTVTGLVRNPTANAALDRVTAVVFLFDDHGGFLTSGRAPLDFQSLSPGEESPFVVAVPAASGVARYRVSFRRGEGGMVSHVNRRQSRLP